MYENKSASFTRLINKQSGYKVVIKHLYDEKFHTNYNLFWKLNFLCRQLFQDIFTFLRKYENEHYMATLIQA